MHKKVGFLLLFGASVAAVAATGVGTIQMRGGPAKPARPAVVPLVAAVQQPLIQAMPVDPAIASAVARWNSLRQTDSLPFSSYSSFLLSYRGWPGESAMRRTAERRIDPLTTPPAEVVRFFDAFPPLSAAGRSRQAAALLALGRVEDARAAARQAWVAGVLPREDEERVLGLFGAALTQADHDERADVLLGNGDWQSAQRVLPLTSPERRALFEARVALQQRAADAPIRMAALGTAATADPGLLADQAEYLRSSGNPLGARQLLAQRRSLSSRPRNPEQFMKTLVTIARGAANDNQWSTVWQITSQVEDLYPPETDVSERSFGERDEYTNLTWLAGTTALRLGRPADAVALFERYGRAAQSPQTRTKGLYWAGRSAQDAGQVDRAQALLGEAARHYDQFYGQLALERLGRPIPAPGEPDLSLPSAAERQAFYNRPIVAAIRHLGRTGSWRDQSEFIRALAQQVDTDSERMLAVQLGREIGRPDLGVQVARNARRDGSFDYKRSGFPEVRLPPTQARHWTISHAIARQESLFDREAISRVGARGLMQLMPGTAREVAGKLGLPYEQERLIRDPDYNVLLGSTYFASLLDQWGGSYPLAVASYNAGAGNVRRWVRENGDPRLPQVDVVAWIEKIPFSETRNYVQRVLENAVVYDLLNPERARSPDRNRLSHYLGKSSRPG